MDEAGWDELWRRAEFSRRRHYDFSTGPRLSVTMEEEALMKIQVESSGKVNPRTEKCFS